MRVKFRLKKRVQLVLALIAIFAGVGFASQQYSRRAVNQIVVNIDSVDNHHFVTEAEVLALIRQVCESDSTHSRVDYVNLPEIELFLKNYTFIADCQVSRDLRGNLIVDIRQRKPLARVVYPKGGGAYIAADGGLMPLSDIFTARVPLISGEGTGLLTENDTLTERIGKGVFEMLSFVAADPFWEAQITQIDIDRYGNLTLYPQLGSQMIEFGEPVNVAKKFRNLMLFYTHIIPAKGWEAYNKVKVAYNNQIVCE